VENQAGDLAHGFGVGIDQKISHEFLLPEEQITQFLADGLVRGRLDRINYREKQRGSLERVQPRIRLAGSRRRDVPANPAQ